MFRRSHDMHSMHAIQEDISSKWRKEWNASWGKEPTLLSRTLYEALIKKNFTDATWVLSVNPTPSANIPLEYKTTKGIAFYSTRQTPTKEYEEEYYDSYSRGYDIKTKHTIEYTYLFYPIHWAIFYADENNTEHKNLIKLILEQDIDYIDTESPSSLATKLGKHALATFIKQTEAEEFFRKTPQKESDKIIEEYNQKIAFLKRETEAKCQKELRHANEEAAQIKAIAEQQKAEILNKADTLYNEIISAACESGNQKVSEAKIKALEIINDAQTSAEKAVNDAQTHADDIKKNAEAEVNRAQQEASEIGNRSQAEVEAIRQNTEQARREKLQSFGITPSTGIPTPEDCNYIACFSQYYEELKNTHIVNFVNKDYKQKHPMASRFYAASMKNIEAINEFIAKNPGSSAQESMDIALQNIQNTGFRISLFKTINEVEQIDYVNIEKLSEIERLVVQAKNNITPSAPPAIAYAVGKAELA